MRRTSFHRTALPKRRGQLSRALQTAAALAGCALVASVLAVVPSAWSTGAAVGATVDRDGGVLVVALASSLSDVGTAVSLVAAGEGAAVVFAESTDSLGSETAHAVARWQPQWVLIVGGVRAIAGSVEDDLRRLSVGVKITRLAGDDRIHTAALAAERVLEGSVADAVIIANGWSLLDVGVAASAVASGTADAVLYANGDDLGDPTRSVLSRHRPRLVLIVGGSAALTPEVQSQAAAAAGGAESRRLGGATRVDTAALVARDAIDGGAQTAVVANGWSLHDVGLAAALAAALPESAVVYTESAAVLGEASEQAIGDARLERILLVGDEASLSAELRTELARSAGTVARITTPVQAFYEAVDIEPPPRFTAIAAGDRRSCALRDDKALICWSEDVDDTASTPHGRFDAVSSGTGSSSGEHACAIREDKTLVCWGNNESGQADAPSGAFSNVAAGGDHSCAIGADAAVVCWGRNKSGQTDAPEGSFIKVTAGAHHSCGLRDDRTIACWGYGASGQTRAPNGTFTEVAAGSFYTCGIREDGTIACWGDGTAGKLDAPAGTYRGISAGDLHTCAIRDDHTASCWGLNVSRQLEAPTGPLAAVAAGSLHTCALRHDGSIECRGAVRDMGWANPNPDGDSVAVQAVYAVPDGESPVSTRRDGIADGVSAAQKWFRSQTNGRHPVFARIGNSIDVKAIRVGAPPTVREPGHSEAMVAEIRATLGLPPYVPLFIFIEGRFGTYGSCGWSSKNFIMVPIANCRLTFEVGARAQWPYGSSYITGHELTHLLGAAPKCAPNNDGGGHVTDDDGDVIWQGSGSLDWTNLQLDVGHDDYYMHGRDDCFDIANHPLLRIE